MCVFLFLVWWFCVVFWFEMVSTFFLSYSQKLQNSNASSSFSAIRAKYELLLISIEKEGIAAGKDDNEMSGGGGDEGLGVVEEEEASASARGASELEAVLSCCCVLACCGSLCCSGAGT